ncbi:MAG: hypothetical protein DME45_00435 [Verrucomicrobia bacterium]|nr:MAG: hypothetical protein DME45_00435 [Verrucomicrobiota bacterium]
MIDFFKRSELVRRGLASGKLRRRRARNDLLRGLEYSVGMKGVLFLAASLYSSSVATNER